MQGSNAFAHDSVPFPLLFFIFLLVWIVILLGICHQQLVCCEQLMSVEATSTSMSGLEQDTELQLRVICFLVLVLDKFNVCELLMLRLSGFYECFGAGSFGERPQSSSPIAVVQSPMLKDEPITQQSPGQQASVAGNLGLQLQDQQQVSG